MVSSGSGRKWRRPWLGVWLVAVLQITPPFALSIRETPKVAFGDLVQSAVANAGTGTTISATFASGVTPGNLIVAVAYSGDGPLSVSGDLLLAVDHHDTGQDDGFAGGYRVVESGDGTTWGFTQPGSDQWAIILYELEGPWKASPLDQTDTTAFSDETVANSQTAGPTSTTTQNDEVAVAAWGFRRTTDAPQLTISTVSDSFINLLQEDDSFSDFQKSVAIATKVLTATGTPSTQATFSKGGVGNWRTGALMMTFTKAAEAGGTTPKGVLNNPFSGPFGGPIG